MPAILALLAIPEMKTAAVMLMGLYIEYGPVIISALSETPMPAGTVARAVVSANSRSVFKVAGNVGNHITEHTI
jgi:hypothetical protein